jgi:hypothetical protein
MSYAPVYPPGHAGLVRVAEVELRARRVLEWMALAASFESFRLPGLDAREARFSLGGAVFSNRIGEDGLNVAERGVCGFGLLPAKEDADPGTPLGMCVTRRGCSVTPPDEQ